MKVYKKSHKSCKICNQFFNEKVKEVYLNFDGNNEIYIERNANHFYLIIKWLGCDNHNIMDYYGEKESVCNKNETKSKIDIHYCPSCGFELEKILSYMK